MTPPDAYIPASKTAILTAAQNARALPEPDNAQLGDLMRVLSAVFHYEAHDDLDQLKALYAPLDPDAPGAEASDAYPGFEAALIDALTRANFAEIDGADIADRGAAKLTADLRIKAANDGIRSIRFFARGAHVETLTIRSLFGLRRRRVEADILNDVVVLVAFKTAAEIKRKDRRAFEDMRRGMRPGAALVKQFRNVAQAELVTLHPGAKPTMRRRDQVFLAVPALAGGVPVAVQIIPAVTVLFAVLATYFGARGAIEDNDLKRALAAVSGLVAVGAFVGRQWMKYERQTLKYQKQLADTVYFRNTANNAGVLDALISAGEEQDVKEAFIAFWALRAAGRPLTRAEIDAAAETFLRERMQVRSDFEIRDALDKLERLRLVERQGDRYAAPGVSDALARLDAAWDNYFRFGRMNDGGAAAAPRQSASH